MTRVRPLCIAVGSLRLSLGNKGMSGSCGGMIWDESEAVSYDEAPEGLIRPCTSVRRSFSSGRETGGAHGLSYVSQCPANNNNGCTLRPSVLYTCGGLVV